MSVKIFKSIFESSQDKPLEIVFFDGDIFILRNFYEICPSIYGNLDGWTSSVVEAKSGKHEDFKRLYKPKSGLDFLERDIIEIKDVETGRKLYEKPKAEQGAALNSHSPGG